MDNNIRSRNPFNLINIKPASPANMKLQLPNFLSTNVRSLFPKLDELELLLQFRPTAADLVAISETWLREGIVEYFLQIPYNFSDVMDYVAEEEEFVPLYQKLSLPSGVMTATTVTMNVCGYGLDLFVSQEPLLV